MTDFTHEFKGASGKTAARISAAGYPDTAFVDPGTGADPSFYVPAHRLAEFTRALYAAAGQVVPDLPVIYDPATVDALAKDLQYAIDGLTGPPGYEHQAEARTLLSLGWRKP